MLIHGATFRSICGVLQSNDMPGCRLIVNCQDKRWSYKIHCYESGGVFDGVVDFPTMGMAARGALKKCWFHSFAPGWDGWARLAKVLHERSEPPTDKETRTHGAVSCHVKDNKRKEIR